SDVLDRLDMGVILFQRDGRIAILNRAAETIVSRQDGLKVEFNRLTTTCRQGRAHVTSLIASACATGPFGGGSAAVERRSGARPYMIQVFALPESERFADGLVPAAVAFIRDPDAVKAPLSEQLRAAYDLTAGEARVALCIAEGLTIAEVGDRL